MVEQTNQVTGREILRFFSPRWFIAIMGTGAVANVLQVLSGGKGGLLHVSAETLMWACVLVFPVALALIFLRVVVDRTMLRKELEHSSLVQFYSAIFIAAAVCATALVKIPTSLVEAGTALRLAKVFWAVSLAFGSVLAVFTPWRIITLNHGELRRILGFWFLPPVGLFVLVFAGNFLALKLGDPQWMNMIFSVNTVLLGVAIFQTIMIFTMFLLRGLTFPFVRPDVIPSFVIGLAPVGVAIMALLSYLPLLAAVHPERFVSVESIAPSLIFGSVLVWGFGFWWMLMALFIVLHSFRKYGIPVTLGYWAFIFPPAAYCLASLTLGEKTGLDFITVTGRILAYGLMVGWVVVLALTLRGIFNRSIFRLPPSFQELLQDGDATGADAKGITFTEHASGVYSRDLPKSDRYRSIEDVAAALRANIEAHHLAVYIALFDHYEHTSNRKGELYDDLVAAMVLVFCFGPKIPAARVLALKPRSFGIAEHVGHFTVNFQKAPSPDLTDTMKQWLSDL